MSSALPSQSSLTISLIIKILAYGSGATNHRLALPILLKPLIHNAATCEISIHSECTLDAELSIELSLIPP